MLKVCIIGAGAIGGFIGARLALTGRCQVAAIARGATLAALQAHGWRLRMGEVEHRAPAFATDDAATLGVQDIVFIAVKGPALEAVAGMLAPLLGPETLVVPAMNGVPWWFCEGVVGWDGGPLRAVDPQGRIAAAIPLAQVLGCVVHASCSCPEPGLVLQGSGQGLIVGEPGGGVSERATALAALLAEAGFDARAADDVRYDVWYKLWGNLNMNPLSAVTGATVDRLLDDPQLRAFCAQVMGEAAAVGRAVGCNVTQSAEDRFAVTRKLGVFKPSMLQDAEAGRMLELDAIVTAVYEIGQRRQVPTPGIAALLGIARVFAQRHGLYPA